MRNNRVAVLDIGSSKVTFTIGERGINGTYIIRSNVEMTHAGFSDKELFVSDLNDEISVFNAIKSAIDKAKAESDLIIEKVYVGLSGTFLNMVVKNHTYNYGKKIKIIAQDVDKFIYTGMPPLTKGAVLVHSQPVYYVLSDNTEVIDPVGTKTSSLSGVISYFYLNEQLKNEIDKVLIQGCKISSVKYVPTSLSESLFLFSSEERNGYVTLLDVGHLNSTFCVAYKNGIVFEKSFAMGGGMLDGMIYYGLGLDATESFEVAQELKKKINLGLIRDEIYEVVSDRDYEFHAQSVNKFAVEYLQDIQKQISKYLNSCSAWLPASVKLNVTGGGISFIRGAAETLRDILDMGVNVVCPSVPQFKNPIESSRLALLEYALNENEKF